MRTFFRNPVVAAASVVIVLAGMGLLAGLVITRLSESYAAGLIASNVGMLLGLLLGYRVYRSERGGRS